MRDDSTPPVPDPELVERFLACECTAAEQEQLAAWAGHTAAGAPVADRVRDTFRQMSAATADPVRYTEALRERLHLGLPAAGRKVALDRGRSNSPIIPWRRLGVAAGLVASGLAAWIVVSRQIMPAERTYQTAAGERAAFMLVDGSRVQLAPNSRVTVPANFGKRSRTVSLHGDAYFTVPHVTGAPFIVQTGTVDTRVLGTTFGVTSGERSDGVRIVVTSGKVSAGWRTGARPVTLTAGMIGRLGDSTVKVTVVPDLAKYIDWTTGQLVFQNVSLGDMLATVSGWYGVEFQLTDSSLVSERVTTTLDGHDEAVVFRALSLLLNAQLTYRTGNDGKLIVTLHSHRHVRLPALRSDSSDLTPSMSFGR
jgi:ferric-dicitrate binding protein FerR (iron transport regulator)